MQSGLTLDSFSSEEQIEIKKYFYPWELKDHFEGVAGQGNEKEKILKTLGDMKNSVLVYSFEKIKNLYVGLRFMKKTY